MAWYVSPGTLSELRGKIARQIREGTGVSEREAMRITIESTQDLEQLDRAGEKVYHRQTDPSNPQRALAMFTGRNHGEIAEALGVHISTVYRWLKRSESQKNGAGQ